jgi:hypothetical protein
MYVRAEGSHGQLVNNIHLFCGIVATQQQLPQYPGAKYDAPNQGSSSSIWVGNAPASSADQRFCPPGLLAVGVHGASGAMVDRLGLICGAPAMGYLETAGRTLGKRKLPDDDTAGRTLGRRRRPGEAGATSSSAAAVGVLEAKRARGVPALYDYFVGRYLLAPTHVIVITRDGDRLIAEEIINGSRFDRQEIFPTSETTFVLEKHAREEVRIRFEFQFAERFDPRTPKAPALFWGVTRAVRVAN